MSDAPEHFVAQDIVEQTLLKPFEQTFILGYQAKSITFYAQQVRALNLIRALSTLGMLGREKRVGIVGAGAAGITAAIAAAACGCRVDVFDRAPRMMPQQRNCQHRLLHPNIYDWPMEASVEPEASVFGLSWTAAMAGHVVDGLDQKWDLAVRTYSSRLAFHRSVLVTDIEAVDQCTRLKLRSTRDRRDLTHEFPPFEIVIFCLGFGIEKGGDAARYWDDDPLQKIDLGYESRVRVLVSGCGDGGLVDTIRLSIDNFNHLKLVDQFLSSPAVRRLSKALIDIDSKADQDAFKLGASGTRDKNDIKEEISVFLQSQYDALDLSELCGQLKQRQRLDTEVTLNGTTQYPHQLTTARHLRLLTHALIKSGVVTYVQGRMQRPPQATGPFRVVIEGTTSKTIEADKIWVRHGAEHPLEKGLNKVAELAKRLPVPGRQDPTRDPDWSRVFWASRDSDVSPGSVAGTTSTKLPTIEALTVIAGRPDELILGFGRKGALPIDVQADVYQTLLAKGLTERGMRIDEMLKFMKSERALHQLAIDPPVPDLVVRIASQFNRITYSLPASRKAITVDDPCLIWNCSCVRLNPETNLFSKDPAAAAQCSIHSHPEADEVHRAFREGLVEFRFMNMSILWRHLQSLFPPSVDTIHMLRDLAQSEEIDQEFASILDLGSGTGILGIAASRGCRGPAELTFAEWLLTPLAYSCVNAYRNRLNHLSSVSIRTSLSYSLAHALPVESPADIVLCNPPYLPLVDKFKALEQAGTVAGTDLLTDLIRRKPQLGRRAFFSCSSLAFPEAFAAAKDAGRTLREIGPLRPVPFRSVYAFSSPEYVTMLKEQRGLEYRPDDQFRHWHKIQVFEVI